MTYKGHSQRDQWRSKGVLRPGGKNIFAPPPTKTAELEVKNRLKSNNILLFNFRSNKICLTLETHSENLF